jgi:hypothetical protein
MSRSHFSPTKRLMYVRYRGIQILDFSHAAWVISDLIVSDIYMIKEKLYKCIYCTIINKQ